jgi:hypothetical protein
LFTKASINKKKRSFRNLFVEKLFINNKETLLLKGTTALAMADQTITTNLSQQYNSLSWDEQVSQEIEAGHSEENTTQHVENDTSNSETRKDIQNIENNTETTTEHVFSQETHATSSSMPSVNKNKEVSSRPWTSLFAKVKRGQSTFSSFSPRNNIKSKNDNALILDIQSLTGSLNEIMVSLHETAGHDIVAAKPHIKKGTRTHLELVFASQEKLKQYATKGVEIFNKTYFGYIPTDSRKSFLTVKIRNVPLGNKETISDEIKKAFGNIGKVVSIKPLLIEGTPYLTDQWIVTFETTEDPDLEEKIPRFYIFMDNKITTEWRSAPKLCYFCDGEGHIKKECHQYKEALSLRQHYNEFIADKKKKNSILLAETNKTVEPESLQRQIVNIEEMVTDELQLKESPLTDAKLVEEEALEDTAQRKEDVAPPNAGSSSGSNKENYALDNPWTDVSVEAGKSNSEYIPTVLIKSSINIQPQANNIEEEFTVVSYKKKKDKKASNKYKQEPVRAAPYKKPRNGVQNSQI